MPDATGETDMKYQKLEGDQCFMIVPPNINVMMTGVQRAQQDKTGLITLVYTDGTTESRPSPDKDISDFANIFSIVGFVQDARAA